MRSILTPSAVRTPSDPHSQANPMQDTHPNELAVLGLCERVSWLNSTHTCTTQPITPQSRHYSLDPHSCSAVTKAREGAHGSECGAHAREHADGQSACGPHRHAHTS